MFEQPMFVACLRKPFPLRWSEKKVFENRKQCEDPAGHKLPVAMPHSRYHIQEKPVAVEHPHGSHPQDACPQQWDGNQARER